MARFSAAVGAIDSSSPQQVNTWHYLHSLSRSIRPWDSARARVEAERLIASHGGDCGTCKSNSSRYLSGNPINYDSPDSYFMSMFKMHNFVSEYHAKNPTISEVEARSLWAPEVYKPSSMGDVLTAVTALSLQEHHRQKQEICLDSWRRFGLPIIAVNTAEEIIELRKEYEQVDEWIECNDVATHYAYPTQYIRTLANVARHIGGRVMVINSDIEIHGQQSQLRDVIELYPEAMICGIRWDYSDCRQLAREFELGIDAVTFTPAQAGALMQDFPFAIGHGMWDYAVPFWALNNGVDVATIHQRLFYHRAHAATWSKDSLSFGWNWCNQNIAFFDGASAGAWRANTLSNGMRYDQKAGRYIRVSTHSPYDAVTVARAKFSKPVETRTVRKIVVLTSPRTGSNLLVNSLANHWQARSAGEWYQSRLPDSAKLNRIRPDAIDTCNLFKLFSMDLGNADFAKIVDGAYVVYLYREDVRAQVASWRRACSTGVFSAEGRPRPQEMTVSDPWAAIGAAEDYLRPLADIVVSYEELVSDWNGTIARILSGAGWAVYDIPQAHRKIAESDYVQVCG